MLHVEFQAVSMDESVTSTVPLRFVGESPAVTKMGGILTHPRTEVRVTARASDLPELIEVDLSSITELNGAIHVSDLPESATYTVIDAPEDVLAMVQPPRVEKPSQPRKASQEPKASQPKAQPKPRPRRPRRRVVDLEPRRAARRRTPRPLDAADTLRRPLEGAAVSGLDQLQYLSWLLYLLIFGAVLVRTIRRPTPAHVDMTLFFGAVAIVIVLTTITSKLHLAADPAWLGNDIVGAAAVSLGYLLLRLVRDFSHVPTLLDARRRGRRTGVSSSAIVVLPTPLPPSPDCSWWPTWPSSSPTTRGRLPGMRHASRA